MKWFQTRDVVKVGATGKRMRIEQVKGGNECLLMIEIPIQIFVKYAKGLYVFAHVNVISNLVLVPEKD